MGNKFQPLFNHHTRAAAHFTKAAEQHILAAKAYNAEKIEQACYHAHIAHSHHLQGKHYANEATKLHTTEE